MKIIFSAFVILSSVQATAVAPGEYEIAPPGQFSIQNLNQLSRASKAIENGDTSIYTYNELYAAKKQLALEQKAFDERYPKRPREMQAPLVNYNPVELPTEWSGDRAHEDLATLVARARQGQSVDPSDILNALNNFEEISPYSTRTAQETEKVQELINVYDRMKGNNDGRPTSIFKDMTDRSWTSIRSAEIRQEQLIAQANTKIIEAKTQEGYSMLLLETLKYPTAVLTGPGPIFERLAVILDAKDINLAVAFKMIVETVQKYGMVQILNETKGIDLRKLDDLIVELTGERPFRAEANLFIRSILGELEKSNPRRVNQTALKKLSSTINSLSVASDLLKKQLSNRLIALDLPSPKVLEVHSSTAICKDMFRN